MQIVALILAVLALILKLAGLSDVIAFVLLAAAVICLCIPIGGIAWPTVTRRP